VGSIPASPTTWQFPDEKSGLNCWGLRFVFIKHRPKLVFSLNPREKTMDEPRTVPSVSNAELEEFFVGGTPAVSAETEKQLLAISSQLSTENPLRAEPVFAVVRGRENAPGEVPPSLRRFLDDECGGLTFVDVRDKRRDWLMAQLMFAGQDLAASRTEYYSPQTRICAECGARAGVGEPLSHLRLCRVGRVRSILQKLVELAGESAGDVKAQACADATGTTEALREFGFSEPWAVGNGILVDGESFLMRTDDDSLELSDLFPLVYRRVAACVNFFEGVATEHIEDMLAKRTTPEGGAR
jgi:hypothetical protein